MLINILAVGDICGVPGLQFLENHLKDFKKAHDIAFAVVNGENANVVGITRSRQNRFSGPVRMPSLWATIPGSEPNCSHTWKRSSESYVR